MECLRCSRPWATRWEYNCKALEKLVVWSRRKTEQDVRGGIAYLKRRYRVANQKADPRATFLVLHLGLYHFSKVNYLTSLDLSRLVCEVGIVIILHIRW